MSPNGVPFCNRIGVIQVACRITPSTGPKHSVWWNHDPSVTPSRTPASSAGWRPGSRARRRPRARPFPRLRPATSRRRRAGSVHGTGRRRGPISGAIIVAGSWPRRPGGFARRRRVGAGTGGVVVHRRGEDRQAGGRALLAGVAERRPPDVGASLCRRRRLVTIATAFLPLVSANRWSDGFHPRKSCAVA